MRAATLVAAALCSSTTACGSQEATAQCIRSADCSAGQYCDYERGLCLTSVRPDAGPTPCQANADCTSGLCEASGVCACTTDTWTNWVGDELSARCGHCHGWAGSRSAALGVATGIRANLQAGSMPPGEPLSAAESDRLIRWIDCGLPE